MPPLFLGFGYIEFVLMFDRLYRKTFGRLVMLFGWLTRPKPILRSEQEKEELAKQTGGMSLYDYKGCPSSLKTRLEIDHLNIEIERRDIRKCPIHQNSLLSQFGQLKAPCLRIEEHGKVQWLDQPDEIVHYLQERFGDSSEGLRA